MSGCRGCERIMISAVRARTSMECGIADGLKCGCQVYLSSFSFRCYIGRETTTIVFCFYRNAHVIHSGDSDHTSGKTISKDLKLNSIFKS